MSSTSFHNFDPRSNGLRCDFPTYKLNLEPRGKHSALRILRVFIRPPVGTFGNPLCTFRQSFASRVLKNRGCSYYGEIFLSINGGFLGASLGFGRLGQTLRRQLIDQRDPSPLNSCFLKISFNYFRRRLHHSIYPD